MSAGNRCVYPAIVIRCKDVAVRNFKKFSPACCRLQVSNPRRTAEPGIARPGHNQRFCVSPLHEPSNGSSAKHRRDRCAIIHAERLKTGPGQEAERKPAPGKKAWH